MQQKRIIMAGFLIFFKLNLKIETKSEPVTGLTVNNQIPDQFEFINSLKIKIRNFSV